jgi:hypothetical protein
MVIVVLLGGFQAYRDTKFHVVGTSPSTGSVGTLSPYLKVNFSKPIVSQGLNVNSPSGGISSYKAQGKTLTIALNYPLSTSKTYAIDINSVYDSSGDQLKDLVFTFKPQSIAFNNLPQNQQKALVNSQDQVNTPGANITYVNTDALINNGISTTQLTLFEQYISEFTPAAETVTINPSSIGNYAGTPPAIGLYKFIVNIDGTDYNAQASYTFLTDLTLALFNGSGTQVFNSATYSTPGGD